MSVTINFNTMTASAMNLGKIGEHNATEIVASWTVTDSRAEQFRIAFHTGGKTVLSETFTSLPITMSLFSELTQESRLSMQIIAYDDDGEYIGKSSKMSGFFFEPSVTGAAVEANGENADIAHEITDIDDRLTLVETELDDDYYTKSQTDTLLGYKQDKLTAGSHITITSEGVISADGVDMSNYYTKTETDSAIASKSHIEIADGNASKYTPTEIKAFIDANKVLTYKGNVLDGIKAIPSIATAYYLDGYNTNQRAIYRQITISSSKAITTSFAIMANINDVPDTSTFATTTALQEVSDSIPTKTSELTNDSGFVTESAIPTVPTNVSAFTNDAGYLTQHQDISGKADKTYVDTQLLYKQDNLTAGDGISISEEAVISADIPTAVSSFTNDAGYQTASQVQTAIDTAISDIPTATTDTAGLVKPDGSTITVDNGVISATGGGGGGGGIDYTKTEQDTGLKWIDGSTIYQRTFNVGGAYSGGAKEITTAMGKPMGKTLVIDTEGFVYSSDSSYRMNYQVNSYIADSGITNFTGVFFKERWASYDESKWYIEGMTGTSMETYITIRYIKR